MQHAKNRASRENVATSARALLVKIRVRAVMPTLLVRNRSSVQADLLALLTRVSSAALQKRVTGHTVTAEKSRHVLRLLVAQAVQ